MKKSLLTMVLLTSAAVLTSCSGTFEPTEATSLEIRANGVNVQIASASGESGYDAFVDALSGAVYNGKLDDCTFGDVMLTFNIDGEDVVLYLCTDDDCSYIVMGDYNAEKYDYLKVSEDDRKVIFDFINEYAS